MSNEPNRHSRTVALWTALLAASCAMTAHSDDNAKTSEWKPLFNGKNLDGWKHVGPGEVVVENGTLKTVGGMGLLWYTGREDRQRRDQGRVPLAQRRQLRRFHSHSGSAHRTVDAGQ